MYSSFHYRHEELIAKDGMYASMWLEQLTKREELNGEDNDDGVVELKPNDDAIKS